MHTVELRTSRNLFPRLLDLVREWIHETGCRVLEAAREEDKEAIVLRITFAEPENAAAFRYAFERT